MTELTEEQLRRIFNESIRPELEAASSSPLAQRAPVLVLVGGQPGAGKTQAIGRIEMLHAGLVKVIGDDMRNFHPGYDLFMEEDPLAMPALTAQASGRWVEMAIQYLRERHISTLVETTLRQSAVVGRTAMGFREAGYRTELHVVAVPLEVSRLGTITRYFRQIEDSGAGRWTPSTAHDVAAQAVAGTVMDLIESGVIDRVFIESRGGTIYYEETPEPGKFAVVAQRCTSAIADAQRTAGMTASEARVWIAEASDAVRACVDTGQTDPDLVATVGRLVNEDAQPIVAAAFPGDPDAQQDVLSLLKREYLPLIQKE